MKSRSLLSKHLLCILLITSIIISCKKDSGADDDSQKNALRFGNISYFANTSGIKNGSAKSTAILHSADVEWSSASVYVEKIAFVGERDNLLDTTLIVEKNLNIFNADALAGIIQLPSGSYKNVKIKMFCKKSDKSELAFKFKSTFTNTKGGKDSLVVGSSYPFEANLAVSDFVINPSDKYKVTFSFDLNKVLTGITNTLLETARSYITPDNKKIYIIWKGGSDDELFYDQVIRNWQTVASVVVSKE